MCDFDIFAIFPSRRRRSKMDLFRLLIALTFMLPSTYGGCEFPAQWAGMWFLSGVPNSMKVNSTHIETKGECDDVQGDKFLVHDRSENCYRCIVIHEKHPSVLQYKETYCDKKGPLSTICEDISGDAPLFSMFRQDPPPKAQPCPFKSAPFTFSYNRGTGDCVNPPSRADSCTDDSRLLLNYQACPDVQSTESNVEELQCLATWKEGSTRYLLGKISQINRRMSDEDSYRCFVYKGNHHNGKFTYDIAQSGDATCNGLLSTAEGSKTLKLTTVDNHHNRCKFPSWITEHHTWHSLDHSLTYHFSLRNATLKISNEENSGNEMRLVCHSILQRLSENNHIQLVAHITRGCHSEHICMMFYRRDSNVIEVRQSSKGSPNPDDACQNFDLVTKYTTLITATLHPKPCPPLGRFNVFNSLAEKRKRRQKLPIVSVDGQESTQPAIRECPMGSYESLSMGCTGAQDTLEFKSSCSSSAYSCHGSWTEKGVHYLIASPMARASTDPRRYCFVYTMTGFGNDTNNGNGDTNSFLSRSNRGRNLVGRESPTLHLSAVASSCSRHVSPGITGDLAYNLTMNGTCAQSSEYNSRSSYMSLNKFGILVVTIPVITSNFLYSSFLR